MMRIRLRVATCQAMYPTIASIKISTAGFMIRYSTPRNPHSTSEPVRKAPWKSRQVRKVWRLTMLCRLLSNWLGHLHLSRYLRWPESGSSSNPSLESLSPPTSCAASQGSRWAASSPRQCVNRSTSIASVASFSHLWSAIALSVYTFE